MHLAADYIHPTPRGGRCRIRIYLPDEERDAVVVICTELPNNPGMSVTNAARRIAAEVIEARSWTRTQRRTTLAPLVGAWLAPEAPARVPLTLLPRAYAPPGRGPPTGLDSATPRRLAHASTVLPIQPRRRQVLGTGVLSEVRAGLWRLASCVGA